MRNIFILASFLVLLLLPLTAQSSPVTQEEPVLAVSSNNICTINWDSVVGRTYLIQYSFDLSLWDYLPLLQEGTGGEIGYWFQCGAPQVYLRLEHTDLPTGGDAFGADFDGDGYTNFNELLAGTSMFIYTMGPNNPGGGNASQLPNYPTPEHTEYVLNFDITTPDKPERRIQLALGKAFEVLSQNGATTQLNGAAHKFPLGLPTGPEGLLIKVQLIPIQTTTWRRKFTLFKHEVSRPAPEDEILVKFEAMPDLVIPANDDESNLISIATELKGTIAERRVFPLEVLVPVLDENYDDTGDLKSTIDLRIAKMNEGYNPEFQPERTSLHDDFAERVLDRFYVRIPSIAGVKVFLSTNKDILGLHVLDDKDEIKMLPDPGNPGFLISKPQLLVTKEFDDLALISDLRGDGQPFDNTHECNGAGALKIHITHNDTTGEVKVNTGPKYLAPVADCIMIPDANGAVAYNDETIYRKIFTDHVASNYRQVNIKVTLSKFTKLEQRPAGLQGQVGLVVAFNQSSGNAIDPILQSLGTNSENDIQIFMFTSLKKESLNALPGGGFSIINSDIAFAYNKGTGASGKLVNTIFLGKTTINPETGGDESKIVATHELAHVLADTDHYDHLSPHGHRNILSRGGISSVTGPVSPLLNGFYMNWRFKYSQENMMIENSDLVLGPFEILRND